MMTENQFTASPDVFIVGMTHDSEELQPSWIKSSKRLKRRVSGTLSVKENVLITFKNLAGHREPVIDR